MYTNTTPGKGVCQIRPRLQLHATLWISLWSWFDLLYRLNCHVDKQPVVGTCFSLVSGLLATAVKVNKSHAVMLQFLNTGELILYVEHMK